MVRKHVYFFLLGLIGIAVISCAMAKSDNVYNEYFKPSVIIERGKFRVGISPSVNIVSDGGHEIELWGKPYMLNIQYYPKGVTVLEGDVFNVNIRSIKTGENVYYLANQIDLHRKAQLSTRKKQKKMLAFGSELLEIPYHDYEVTFEYKILSDKEVLFETGQIKIDINRNHYKAKRRRGVGVI